MKKALSILFILLSISHNNAVEAADWPVWKGGITTTPQCKKNRVCLNVVDVYRLDRHPCDFEWIIQFVDSKKFELIRQPTICNGKKIPKEVSTGTLMRSSDMKRHLSDFEYVWLSKSEQIAIPWMYYSKLSRQKKRNSRQLHFWETSDYSNNWINTSDIRKGDSIRFKTTAASKQNSTSHITGLYGDFRITGSIDCNAGVYPKHPDLFGFFHSGVDIAVKINQEANYSVGLMTNKSSVKGQLARVVYINQFGTFDEELGVHSKKGGHANS